MTAGYPLIGYFSYTKTFSRVPPLLFTLRTVIISSVFRTMSDKQVKQKKGFGRKHFSLARAAIEKRQKSGDEAGEAPPSSTMTLSTTEPTVDVSRRVLL